MDEAALIDRLPAAIAARVQTLKLRDRVVTLVLDGTGLEPETRAGFEATSREILLEIDGIDEVRIAVSADRVERRIIAIGSGKGGVGKSTLTANLAVALHRMGHKVGLVDADVYGPSQPTLLATKDAKPQARDEKLQPVVGPAGIPMLSMGHMVAPGKALAWRGPMAGNAFKQLVDAHWGDVELLLVDLPPGTGDVQLSMLQKHPPSGAIIVSTPQDLALIDAQRAANLFDGGKVPIIGLVENMAGYTCPHCGEVSDPFGSGGVEAAAQATDIPFLGRIPLAMAIRKASDAGTPPAAGDGPEGAAFRAIAEQLAQWLGAQSELAREPG